MRSGRLRKRSRSGKSFSKRAIEGACEQPQTTRGEQVNGRYKFGFALISVIVMGKKVPGGFRSLVHSGEGVSNR